MNWRWDQGRLEYFRVENIRKIARVLCLFDGLPIKGVSEDILREPLHQMTGMAFPPENNPDYKVWRNFGRVFGQLLLATQIDGRLYVSEVCRNLAQETGSMSDEQYMQFWVTRYAMPSPSFEGYDENRIPSFPFCALIKLALARLAQGGKPVSAMDAAKYLIGNNVTGEEDLPFYVNLAPSWLNLPAQTLRQVREMIAVLGQIPFLKWESAGLVVDRSAFTSSFEVDIMAYASPSPSLPRTEKAVEILKMGSLTGFPLMSFELPESSPEELSFIEGSRKRVTHVRIERSWKLRQIYIGSAKNPSLCDMCTLDTRVRYPWTSWLIEVHHLLPLGSLLSVETKSTSIADVVGVCPSCHKATHQFYKVWLAERGLEDFQDKKEARRVYDEAKRNVIIAA